MNFPEELSHNPHFSRYFRTWQKNPLSIVFIPLAQICREKGHLQEAQEICEKGLSHHPHSVSGRLMLARIYFDMDKMKEARGVLEEILKELPVQKEALILLARINQCTGVSKNDPRPVTSGQVPSLWENFTMAQIYADQGELKTAVRILDKILMREPGHQKALQLREKLI